MTSTERSPLAHRSGIAYEFDRQTYSRSVVANTDVLAPAKRSALAGRHRRIDGGWSGSGPTTGTAHGCIETVHTDRLAHCRHVQTQDAPAGARFQLKEKIFDRRRQLDSWTVTATGSSRSTARRCGSAARWSSSRAAVASSTRSRSASCTSGHHGHRDAGARRRQRSRS